MESNLRFVDLFKVIFLTAVLGCGETTANSPIPGTDDTSSPAENATDTTARRDTTSDSPQDTGNGDTARDTSRDTVSDTSDSEIVDTTGDDTGNSGADAGTASSVWGWISAIEWNDACDQWDQITDWTGGVRAYFAESATYPRSLLHTLDFIPETASEGSCKLYDAGIMANCEYADDCFTCVDASYECWRICGADEECLKDDEEFEGVCTDLPEHWNLGTITLSGFKESITLEPDEYDRYYTTKNLASPNDLFDDGDVLIATTEGGALSPLTFTTKGVAPLEISGTAVDLYEDSSATVSWTPADDDSRIQISLNGGSHDPNPLTVTIVCDVPDSDGRVEIPASIVNGFLAASCSEALMKCSRITRYTRDVQTIGDKEIELFVGSARNLQIWTSL